MKDVRFADDQGMVADSESGLQRLMDGLVRIAKQYDMTINVKKTKVMRVSRKGEGDIRIFIEGHAASGTGTKVQVPGKFIDS